MITEITLENFKSYKKANLTLAPMTFLIGPNASGKSNALEAIRLLNWLSKGSRLEDIERDIQGGNAVVRGTAKDLFRDPNTDFVLGCHFQGDSDDWNRFSVGIGKQNDHLVINHEQISGKKQTVPLFQIDGKASPHSDEVSVAYNNFKKGGHKPHIPCSNRQAIFYQLETPGRFDKSHEKSQKVIPSVTKLLRETLKNIVILDPKPALMREYVYSKDDEIEENGRNLSAVLHSICEKGEVEKLKLLNFIKSLPEQDISDIKFIETARDDVMVSLEESFGDKKRTVDAPLLSDGTLRVLAIAATLLTAKTGGLVIIEEIDNGVHPSRARSLVNQIKSLATERDLRVLVTSHNPALMDALPDDSLKDVLCCFRGSQDGASQLVRLGDLDRFSELAAQGPLGRSMTLKVLDQYLKDENSPEQRQALAQEWMRELIKASETSE